MKQWWRRVRVPIFGSLAYFASRTIVKSLRLKIVGWERYRDNAGARIYAGWHGRSLIPANVLRGRGVWAIISHSRDGEIQKRIFAKFGFQIIRGSSGRGGERALVESIRALKAGGEMAITPDGPRGPGGVVQGGVMLMAKKSGCQLVPVGSSAKPCWHAPTWDRYMVPCPFAKAVFVFGDPITVPKDADDEQVEAIRIQFEQAINAIQAEADRLVGIKPSQVA